MSPCSAYITLFLSKSLFSLSLSRSCPVELSRTLVAGVNVIVVLLCDGTARCERRAARGEGGETERERKRVRLAVYL